MNAIELRKKFIEFFEGKDHKVILSASLVPKEQDITESDMTLFTTAGMQQFKRFYVNPNEAPFSRATSSQKCIRTGDIYEVGDDTHLSFFEMLGNFSFNDYFKKEAIEYAWEFLTKVCEISEDRIKATYFNGEGNVGLEDRVDTESKNYIKEITKLPDDKIIGQPFKDNFWSLGSMGSPGGRTVEFYIDEIEVWNLVFNEFEWKGDHWEDLKFKGVDTGMGLERLLTVKNKKGNVYETDLFGKIIEKIEEISGKKYSGNKKEFRIIADHIKAATFAINDGITPSNKGAGYVVRRLIRRAIVKAQQLGIKENFTTKLADGVFTIYDGVYFNCHSEFITRSNSQEFKALKDCSRLISESHEIPKGIQILKPIRQAQGVSGIESQVQDDTKVSVRDDKGAGIQDGIKKELEKEESKFRTTLKDGLKIIGEQKEATGKILFDLYQSFGLPLEISIEEFKRLNITINNETTEQYNNLVKEHQEKSRTASAGMFKGGLADAGEIAVKYHTATHLLHQALRQVLGDHVQQKGSNITAERLRFDFVHTDKMTPEQISKVEDIVNEKIKADLSIMMEEMSPEEAKGSGAIGLFEHKYGDKVKVYTIGLSTSLGINSGEYFSREICGGPHVTHTGELGHFKILKEESSSAGVRRIKAVLE